jgi:tetratricopeptide (TPR) repeat protein
VHALRELASVLTFEGESERGADLAREALWLGQALAVPTGELADLLVVSGISVMFLNRFVESEALFTHAIRLAERADDTVGLSRALLNLSGMMIAIAPAASVQYSRRSYELSRRMGATMFMRVSLDNMAIAMMLAGDWDGAEALLRRAMTDDGLDVEEEVQATWATLAALRGDLDTARAYSNLEVLRSTDDGQLMIVVACLDALIAYADGRPEQAVEHARRMLGVLNIGLAFEYVMLGWALIARSAYESGDLATVADLVERLDSQAPGHIPPLLRAELTLHRTWLLAARGGDDTEVTRGYADAVAQLRAYGSPYHLGHARLDEARHLRAIGRADDADAAVAEAMTIATRLGARPLAARAEAAAAPRPVG